MNSTSDNIKEISGEDLEQLRQELAEARELINAIKNGEIDALAVQGAEGPQIFTLKGADHTYRLLVEEMNEGAITINKEGIILYSNARFAKFLNLPLEKVIGLSFYNFIREDYTTVVENLFRKGWEGSSRGEVIIKDSKGSLNPFSLSIKPLPFNDSPVLVIILTDLSQQREIFKIKSQIEKQDEIISEKNAELKHEKKNKAEAEKFRFVLEMIPQMTWTNLPTGEVNFYNQRWYDYTGMTFENTKDWGWGKVVHPEDLEATVEAFTNSLKTGKIFEIENRYKRAADGAYRWHLNRAIQIKDEIGDTIFWVGTATDINDQKSSKQKLDNINVELSTKNHELSKINNDLDSFIYTASHDLKAPVSNIEGLINALPEVVNEETSANSDFIRIMEMINFSIGKFKGTIQDLSDITRIQRNIDDDIIEVNVSELVNDIIMSIHEDIKKAQAQIILNIDSCPTIKYSRRNLRSIIYNLISNAIKYKALDRAPFIEISTKCLPGTILLTVKDNGLGIEEANTDKIFSMFKRMHDHVEGTGIGLYIVKRIIDNNNGRIEVESEVDKGSTFKVYFKN